MRPAARLAAASARRPIIVLVAAAALFTLAIPGLLELRVDTSPEAFFPVGTTARADHARLLAEFGTDAALRVVLDGRALRTEAARLAIRDLEERLSALDVVEDVVGPTRLLEFARSGGESWIDRLETVEAARESGVVARDGSAVSVLVSLAPAQEPAGAPLGRLRAAVSGVSLPPGVRARVVGLPVLDEALDAAARQVQAVFLPALVLVTISMLSLLFRSWRRVLLPVLLVGWTEAVTLGAMGAFGVPLDLVVVILPSLLLVVAMATALHVLMRFDALRLARPRASRSELAVATFEEKAGAVAWMGVTTAAGFGSLALSRIAPVRAFGTWAAVGLALLTLAALTLYPAALAVIGSRSARSAGAGRAGDAGRGRIADQLGRRLGRFVVRRRGLVLVIAAALLVAALAGVTRLRVESDALRWLPRASGVRAAIEEVEERGIGVATLELLVELPDPADSPGLSLDTPEDLASFLAVSRRLRELPGVLGAFGPGDALLAAAGPPGDAPLPDATRAALALGIVRALPAGRRALGRFLDQEGRRGRVTVFVPTGGFETIDPIVAGVGAAGRDLFPGARVAVTGRLPLLLDAQRMLLRTLLVSLGTTLLVVAAVLRLLLGSTRSALVAMLPNIWPVAGVLGVMGWAGVPLDVGTVMVASVALGLAVDDTIQTLEHFRALAPRLGPREAVVETLVITGPAYLVTGSVLIGGFLVLGLSEFLPTARFGLLAGLAMALAVVCDLLFLPALLAGMTRVRPAPATGERM